MKVLNLGLATFFKKTLFLTVKTVFLLVEFNFFHFSDTPADERYFVSSRKVFFTPYGRERFSVFLLFEFFFLQVETFTEISGKKLFGKDFVPVERDFPLSGTCFFPARGNRY